LRRVLAILPSLGLPFIDLLGAQLLRVAQEVRVGCLHLLPLAGVVPVRVIQAKADLALHRSSRAGLVEVLLLLHLGRAAALEAGLLNLVHLSSGVAPGLRFLLRELPLLVLHNLVLLQNLDLVRILH